MLALRCALAHYLLELTSGDRQPGSGPSLLRCTAGPGGLEAPGLVPTLFLLKDALLEVGAARARWAASIQSWASPALWHGGLQRVSIRLTIVSIRLTTVSS